MLCRTPIRIERGKFHVDDIITTVSACRILVNVVLIGLKLKW